MTVWADDEDGLVQVEMGCENGQVWLTFNKKTSVVLMSEGEAWELARQIKDMLDGTKVAMRAAQGGQLEVVDLVERMEE
jgi:hypothetical protein